MHARMTTIEMDPGRIDAVASELEERDLPEWEELPGFRGFILAVNRTSGKVVGTSYWDSEEEMNGAEAVVKDARRRAADTGGATAEPSVERFEIALDVFVPRQR